MASTSAGVSKLVHGKSVPAVDVTYEAIEDVLDADSDIDIEHEFSDNEVGVEDIGSDNEIDDFVPVGSKEESVLWRAINGSNINRHHFIDTSSGVQPHTQLNSDSLPHEIFLNFFTDNLVELIVTETNNYQDRVKQDLISNDKLTPKSRLHKWTDLTKDEFYSFISLIILMGIIRKPTLAMYWSTDEMLSTPFFGKCMAQNRFSEILRFLHFTSTNLPDDKLHKIRPVFEYLITKFMENYRPGEKVTVDESLMLWKGRLGWKQFIRTKRARFGIKSFDLCECKTGYVYNSSIYTGKGTDNTGDSELGLSGSMVMHLMGPLLEKGRTVYLDNWYSSPKLYVALSNRGTNACGTVRTNRVGLPKDIDARALERGEMEVRQLPPLTYIIWKDKRDVTALSNCHSKVHMIDSGKTDYQTKMTLFKPDLIHDYNMNMGGVDLVDQVTQAYPSMRKTIKWYKKLFLHMLDITLYNSLVIWRNLNPHKRMTYLDFRLAVARKLVEEHHIQRPIHTGGRKSKKPAVLRLKEKHFASRIPPTGKKKYASRRCVVCKNKGLRKEVRIMCAACGEVPLCFEPCFEIYHTHRNI